MPPARKDRETPPPEKLRATLQEQPLVRLPSEAKAAIAVVFESSEPRLLFIQRAEHPHDPWSGHIAFPGGRHDPEDADLRATAQRETLEEIGLDLTKGDYLGQLDDVQTNISSLVVSGFAYAAPRHRHRLNEEVEDCFWVPLSHLAEERRRTHISVRARRFPALSLNPDKPLLWGITYRFVEQVLARLSL